MLGGRAVAADRLDGGAAHILVVIEPLLPQQGNRNGLEAQGARRSHFELRIDLGGHLPRGVTLGTDPRLPPSPCSKYDRYHTRPRRYARTRPTRNEVRWLAISRLLQRSFPLQTATKTATTGAFLESPETQTHVSNAYDTWAANEAERTGYTRLLSPTRLLKPVYDDKSFVDLTL